MKSIRLLLQLTTGVSILGLAFPTCAYAEGSKAALLDASSAKRVEQVSLEAPVTSLIVKLKDNARGATASELKNEKVTRLSAKSSAVLTFQRHMSGNAHVLALPKPMTVSEAKSLANTLATDADIEYVEPDIRMKPFGFTPTDPGYTQQWHLKTPDVFNVGGINAPPVWSYGLGNSNITVAIVDTGVRQHADLGALLSGYDFIADTTYSSDGNGRDADATDTGDWSASGECGASSIAENSTWHGTHVAGTVAEQMNNIGGAGVAPNVRILPVRVLGKCGGTVSDIVDGMRWAAGLAVPGVPNNPTPAQVINMSLGGSGACSATYSNAINEIVASGKVVVVATGNNGQQTISQPANCPGVIAVTAHSMDGDNADYANIGTGTTISAPGGGCSTTANKNGTCTSSAPIFSLGNTGTKGPGQDTYAYKQGTSMATAATSGVIAMMFSTNPTLTPAQVKSVIVSTARPHPASGVCGTNQVPNISSQCGAGLIDVAAAVDAVSGNPVVSVSPVEQVVLPGAKVSLKGVVTPTMWHSVNTYQWSTANDNPQSVTLQGGNTPDTTFTLNKKGKYQFTLTSVQDDGKSGSATVAVTVNTPPVLGVMPDLNIVTGSTVNTQIVATDADADTLVYTAVTLPTGATLTNQGVIKWDTTGMLGTYVFEVLVSDGISAPQTTKFNVTVTAPVITNSGNGKSGGGGSMDIITLLLMVATVAVLRMKKVIRNNA